jgi:hypothetical protein
MNILTKRARTILKAVHASPRRESAELILRVSREPGGTYWVQSYDENGDGSCFLTKVIAGKKPSMLHRSDCRHAELDAVFRSATADEKESLPECSHCRAKERGTTVRPAYCADSLRAISQLSEVFHEWDNISRS